ncbi:ABC transporter permease subunit [Methylocapsa aurea]|uniref:ABC transporter permease subunit n=1 Tax=Methylocapsa aurea TaxID=663610 RepID=UPI0005620E4B|nr:DUF3526 domain-containing protein [Methylocapsa aurea]
MIGVIARKELLELWRDHRFRIAALILSLTLLVGGAFGWANFLDLRRQAQTAGQDERERWLSQGDKYPHAAAHYGVFAFKSPRPLAIMDSGIQPYVGALVWLEAHKQNEMLYRPAEDATALQRFGDLTPAAVGQSLIPLLIIFVAYGAFTREREQGTLPQLASLGVRPSDLLLGKAAGIACAFLPILLPAFLLLIVAIAALTPTGLLFDELARAGLLALIYAAYFALFLFLSLAVSAWRRSSATALAILLSFWALSVLAAPRALSDWAKILYPTASSIELKHGLDRSLGQAQTQSWEKTRAELLEQFHADKVEDLPFAFDGAALQADEESAYALFQQHYGRFFATLRQQNAFFQLGALLSPLAGVQLSSMALAGNDLGQHQDFILQAEANRRVIHTMINEYIVRHSAKNDAGEWRSQAGRDLWERIPAFDYQPPRWPSALPDYGLGLGLLAAWLLGSIAAAFQAVARMKIA